LDQLVYRALFTFIVQLFLRLSKALFDWQYIPVLAAYCSWRSQGVRDIYTRIDILLIASNRSILWSLPTVLSFRPQLHRSVLTRKPWL